MISSRRGFLTGLGAALITAPAIVRAGSLMPVRVMIEPVFEVEITRYLGFDIVYSERLFDFDAAKSQIFKIMAVPPQWLVDR